MSLPGPPPARLLGVDHIPWTMDKPVCDELWPAILVSENDALMGYLGVHSHEDGVRGSILQVVSVSLAPLLLKSEKACHVDLTVHVGPACCQFPAGYLSPSSPSAVGGTLAGRTVVRSGGCSAELECRVLCVPALSGT